MTPNTLRTLAASTASTGKALDKVEEAVRSAAKATANASARTYEAMKRTARPAGADKK